jgi:hypothetical protein
MGELGRAPIFFEQLILTDHFKTPKFSKGDEIRTLTTCGPIQMSQSDIVLHFVTHVTENIHQTVYS